MTSSTPEPADDAVDQRPAGSDRRLADIEGRLRRQRRELDRVSREVIACAALLQRLMPQLAAVEVRLSEQRRDPATVTGTPDEVEEARSIVEEVRREHDRVRARLSGVAWYEDRLRKLEERIEALASGSEEAPHG